MRLFLMTSDTIDVLYFIFFKFVFTKIFKTQKKTFSIFKYFFTLRNCNKLSLKNKSYQKSTKINAFEQKICVCHSPGYHAYALKKLIARNLCERLRSNALSSHGVKICSFAGTKQSKSYAKFIRIFI